MTLVVIEHNKIRRSCSLDLLFGSYFSELSISAEAAMIEKPIKDKKNNS